ncbi:YqaE/Pmp3 family membrane protein [Hwanghaeella grinnelliae]|uniref:YqaE/Pmp3 family membrane protein n=1 Tax=Hwanghaeella grinnelliae TaxID=2500179 RepID=A0A3S2VQM1_9PROT|nr:YqaE/Pmp3 family membrane protein [Hwanghaeella grinnelliae]
MPGSVAFLRSALRCRDVGPSGRCEGENPMIRLLIALILPWLTFFTIGKPFQGIICLILQLTVIGWVPAAIWAVYALSQYNTDKKIREAGMGSLDQ